MKKLLALIVFAAAIVACTGDNPYGPDKYARQHAIQTAIVPCSSGAFDLRVSWVDWKWQAIFLRGAQQIAIVTDSSLTHSSGCVYAAGDKARVKLVPLGDIARYLDSAFVDVDIR